MINQKFFTHFNRVSFLLIIGFTFSGQLLYGQWTNNAGVTSHDQTTDDVLISGTSMTGQGIKFFWNNSKYALRAGGLFNVNGDNWNLDSLGTGSVALGIDTKALGYASSAFGNKSYALGPYSFAVGDGSHATNFYSMAMGLNNLASDQSSIAIGSNNESTNAHSISIGKSNISSGSTSIAIGTSNESTSTSSIAIGGLCKTTGALGSTALGYASESLANRAFAIGYKTKALADNSFVLGSGPGTPGTYMENNTPNSMVIGFNSSTPTMFIGPGNLAQPGKVGIGTITPTTELDINGGLKIANTNSNVNGTMRFSGSDFEGYYNGWKSLINTDAQTLMISGNQLSITGGNIITLPSGGSDNWGTQVVQSSSLLSGNGTTASPLSLAQQGATAGQVLKWDGNNWTPDNDDQGNTVWNQAGTNINYTTGNVGIGTANPLEEIHIESPMPELKFTTDNTGSGASDGFEIGVNTGSGNVRAKLWQFEDGHMVFGTNNLERVRIHKSGSVGIGTIAIPLQKLDIAGAINLGNTTIASPGAIRYDGTDFEGYDGNSWQSLTSGGAASVWSVNGTDIYNDALGVKVGIGTNAPVDELHVAGNIALTGEVRHPSDRRLKTDIVDLDNALEIINKLSPKSYYHSEKGIDAFKLSDKKQYGLIAQEVQKILPDLVTEDLLTDEDGISYMAMNYEQLIPILIQALQEAQKEKAQLGESFDLFKKESQTQLNTLSSEIENIKNMIKKENQF